MGFADSALDITAVFAHITGFFANIASLGADIAVGIVALSFGVAQVLSSLFNRVFIARLDGVAQVSLFLIDVALRVAPVSSRVSEFASLFTAFLLFFPKLLNFFADSGTVLRRSAWRADGENQCSKCK
ncbi:MAG: hypothetical protein HY22_06865 [[Candidatus Thermochlorobacteriaceae] bacterium GBChlB]|nr:MAG: hypothetical protein HY22_06865 [[Candidatus Thermochlorobacteriaceae] bacterium GBChlB]